MIVVVVVVDNRFDSMDMYFVEKFAGLVLMVVRMRSIQNNLEDLQWESLLVPH